MIPRAVAEELGLPLPLFIKWDDAEYGLRAGEARLPDGHRAGHRDLAHGVERQGRRDRLAGLLPPAQPAGGRVHLHWDGPIDGLICSSMSRRRSNIFSAWSIRRWRFRTRRSRDFLAGPEHIFSHAASGAARSAQRCASEYPDAVVLPAATALPAPRSRRRTSVQSDHPWRMLAIGARLAAALVHQLRPADPRHHERPQLNVATQDARWFLPAHGSTVSPSPPPTAAASSTVSATGQDGGPAAKESTALIRNCWPAVQPDAQGRTGTRCRN